MNPSAGWFPDPAGSPRLCYFDGHPSDEMSAVADGVHAAEGTAAWSKDGGGGDVTELVPDITQAAPTEMAWSEDDENAEDDESGHHPWREALAGATPVLFIVAMVTLVVAVVGFIWIEQNRHQHGSQTTAATPSTSLVNPTSTPPPTGTSTPTAAPAQPVLNGVYQVVLNASAATYQGSLNMQGGLVTKWFAFRPQCTSAGCVIHGVMLDDNNHTQAASDIETLNYVNDRWVEVPVPHSDLSPGCSEGTQQFELRPAQPDGTWVGSQTLMVTSNCPDKGSYAKAPITATWIGPVPAGLLGNDGGEPNH
jgi:hypothetical protein